MLVFKLHCQFKTCIRTLKLRYQPYAQNARVNILSRKGYPRIHVCEVFSTNSRRAHSYKNFCSDARLCDKEKTPQLRAVLSMLQTLKDQNTIVSKGMLPNGGIFGAEHMHSLLIA